MKYSVIKAAPRMLRKEDAGQYVGSPKLLAQMQASDWISPAVARHKLVLYDVNEADPYRGAVFVMGIGIGEMYSSAGWEDRGFRLSGPATLEARAALRHNAGRCARFGCRHP